MVLVNLQPVLLLALLGTVAHKLALRAEQDVTLFTGLIPGVIRTIGACLNEFWLF